jgi:hypothetical protein
MRSTPKLLLATLALLMFAGSFAQAAEKKLHPSGSVVIDQGQAGYIVTAGFGGGTLRTGGHSYAFRLGGLGIGGVGISSIKARGTVYNLGAVRNFPGQYVALRTGGVLINKSIGKLWLKNSNGVVMELKVQRKGLMLSTGVDGVVVTMK